MMRDRNLLRRDLLAIPGGLLAAYGLVGLLYALFWRSDEGPCVDSYRLLVSGACYNILPLLITVFLLGLTLLLVGILVFRGRVERLEGHLHSGTPTHFFLAFLVSMAAIPGIAALILRYVERSNGLLFTTSIGGTLVKTVALFVTLALAGALMLLPYAILLGRQAARRRRFLSEARRVVPAVPGETRARGRAAVADDDEEPSSVPDEADWPESR